MKRRDLTPEDLFWWQQVAQQVQPMEARLIETPMHSAMPRVREGAGTAPRFEMPAVSSLPPLMAGGYAGIDRRLAERFKRGELLFDGTVDLHGMSREQAHRTVTDFVHMHYARGSRCVLAITGKGGKKAGAETGVLKELLPQWLAEPGLRPLVLACDLARQRHGGAGAYYILLRRRRA